MSDTLLLTAKLKLQEYAGNLHEEVAFNLLNLGFFGLHVDNHALRSAGALGLAAIVLNDVGSASADDRPTAWLATGLYNIDNVFWRDPSNAQSAPGVIAGYAEGPHYLRFGMKHALPFFHALGNFIPDTTLQCSFNGSTRTIAHPWFDPNYANLYEWIMRIRLPDGRFPALEDAFGDVCYPDLAITENPAYHAPMDFSRFHPSQPASLWEQLNHSSDDMVADYIAARTSMTPVAYPEFMALPRSGNLIYRSGWDSTSTYMHFTAKNGRARTSAKGHNHADASSFILVGRGQMLALDPGYVKWDRRLEVAEAQHHNLILVDGAGPTTAQTANAGDADAFIEDAFDLQAFDYAEVRTAYAGADFVRRPVFMRKDYFILADQCTDNASHNYAWRLHGYGLENGDSTHGQFHFDPARQRGTWTKNGVNLLAHTVARGGANTYTRLLGKHELYYDSLEAHTTFQVEKTGTQASFLSVLMPYELDTPQVQTLCAPNCGTIKITRNGFEDFATTESLVTSTISGLPADLTTDANLAIYSQTTSGTPQLFLLAQGEYLAHGSDTLLRASIPMDLAYSILDTVTGEGFATLAGTISIYHPWFVPGTVLGTGVTNWSFDPLSEVLTIQSNAGGHFDVLQEVIIGLQDQPHPQVTLEVWPVPAGDFVQVRTSIGEGTLEWLSLDGRVLKTWNLDHPSKILDLKGLPSGAAILRFTPADATTSTAKLITRIAQ